MTEEVAAEVVVVLVAVDTEDVVVAVGVVAEDGAADKPAFLQGVKTQF